MAVSALFNGTFVQNFDAKGRVSVPAKFRDALREGAETQREANGIVTMILRPSDTDKAIEARTEVEHQKLIAELERLDPLSEEYNDLALNLFARAWPLETDKEGRLIIPDTLLAHADIPRGERVTFLGMGTRFLIMRPDMAEERLAKAVVADLARRQRTRPSGGQGVAP